MDDLLDKFNSLDVNKANDKEINDLNAMMDEFKTKISILNKGEYSDEWSRFFKNYKKINNLSNILRAFKSSPGWHSSIERSYKIFLEIIDKLNQYYLDSIDFSTVEGPGEGPQIGDYWDRESARDTLQSIKGLLEQSIKVTGVEEKITVIVDAYTLIVLLFEPVFDLPNGSIDKIPYDRIKTKLPKSKLGVKGGGVNKKKRLNY